MSTLQAYDTPGTHKVSVIMPAVTAADGGTAFVVFTAPVACFLEKLNVVPATAITGQDTNTKHLNVINRGTTGGGSTEIGNYDLTSGFDIGVAGLDIYAPASSLSIAAGTQIGLTVEDQGTGIAIPALLVTVEFAPN